MKKYSVLIGVLIACLWLGAGQTFASELSFTFTNPSFGGNPFFNTHLLNTATVQNRIRDDQPAAAARDPLASFEESLQRQILSRLSRQILEQAFGEQEIVPGQFEIGDFFIDITSDIEGLTVNITDPSTGSSTTVVVPFF